MSNGSAPKFTFFPRPEAHSMKWDELLPPLRRAVRDLLLRLDGAVKKVDQSMAGRKEAKGGEITADCFLVYGERGTGKTTVLLSARDAVSETCNDFFGKGKENWEAKIAKDYLCKDAENSAGELKRKAIVWLDVLDLESLPLRANLLTTMLTRVRNSLCSPGHEKKSLEATSILEEGADSARHKLDQLIKDATLMWEDIHEPDTRNRANRQVAAADIYAQYRERFHDAMETLSRELGRRSGRSDEYQPLVLPIDNIDRSTDHLYNIVKLAQMVACPHLWLVMAGDREDVETFLERAYWKELITLGEGAGGTGKVGLGGEDESLVMARRQAAAASHKLLPPSHRIEVDLVSPIDTLQFCPSSIDKSGTTDSTKDQTIYELLERVEIPNLGNGPRLNFVELFEARKHVEALSKEPRATKGVFHLEPKYLTHATRLGLHLPARGVLDLWQLAHWAVNDGAGCGDGEQIEAENRDDFRAEKIARTMVRNIIAESKMSSATGRYLQERIIRRDPDRTTILNFREPNPSLNVTSLRGLDFDYRVTPKMPLPEEKADLRYAVRSTLSAVRGEGVVLFSLERKSAQEKGADTQGGANGEVMELSPVVAGWLSVLHDVMSWAKKSWVIGKPLYETDIHFVRISHEVVCIDRQQIRKNSKNLWWPSPRWNTFFANDVFWLRWEEIRSSIGSGWRGNEANRADYLPWVLAVGWVACVLDTFWALAPQGWGPVQGGGEPHGRDDYQQREMGQSEAPQPEDLGGTLKTLAAEEWGDANIEDYEKHIGDCEKKVMKAAADLYGAILADGSNPDHERVFFKNEGVTFMRDWLEQRLPLLLGHLYVPTSEGIAKRRRDNILAFLMGGELTEDQKMRNAKGLANTRALVESWKRNAPFILADIEKEFEEMFTAKGGHMDLLGPFADLHHLWLDPSSQSS